MEAVVRRRLGVGVLTPLAARGSSRFSRASHAVEHRHYVTDIHATLLHQLGLDSRRMVLPGRKRLEKDHGHVIEDIVA